MDTKFIKSVSQKKPAKDYDLHVSGIAATIFGVFLAAAIVGALIMDRRVHGGLIGLYVSGMTLIG
ncbi:MAG TPA: hypothetical protein VKE92_06055, partial [Anaerolineales bacterium]|nr:hypothetical protein [Anaerolineales bacterium]